jgi:hypothetical protein
MVLKNISTYFIHKDERIKEGYTRITNHQRKAGINSLRARQCTRIERYPSFNGYSLTKSGLP